MKTTLIVIAVACLLLAGCGGDVVATEAADAPIDEALADGGEEITPDAGEQAPGEGALSGPGALPIEPQVINFQAADGQALTGRYYPAAVNPAPVVVLIHWIAGDMNDWNEVAPWMQNRGLQNPFPNPGDNPWWDPSWFPKLAAGRTYGVFAITLRGCLPFDQRGCATIDEAGWLLDVQAAMLQAGQLEGADPERIVAIGSSIGADGAVDGCVHLNQQQPGACKGALSLSPGGYLTIQYAEAVRQLGENQPQTPAWCLADSTEIAICNTALNVGNAAFQAHEIPGQQHGNMMMQPNLNPLPMQLILDFLALTLGE